MAQAQCNVTDGSRKQGISSAIHYHQNILKLTATMCKNNPSTQMSHFWESKERSKYTQERRKKKKVNRSEERGRSVGGGVGWGLLYKVLTIYLLPFFVWEETISFLSALFPVFDWITVAKSLTEPSVYIQQ